MNAHFAEPFPRVPDLRHHGELKHDHAVILIAQENEEVRRIAQRLCREAGISVDVRCANLSDETDVTMVEAWLRKDHHIGVLLRHVGTSLMVAFSTTRIGLYTPMEPPAF